MLNISQLLAQELSPSPFRSKNALELLAEGATVPFTFAARSALRR